MNKVSIELGGQEYELKYKFSALAELEDQFGISISNMESLFREATISTVAKLIVVGISHVKEISYREVLSIIDEQVENGEFDFSELVDGVADSLRKDLEQIIEKKTAKMKKKAASQKNTK